MKLPENRAGMANRSRTICSLQPSKNSEALGTFRPIRANPTRENLFPAEWISQLLAAPDYDPAKPLATREAYGNALKRIGAVNPRLIDLSGDVDNSTFSEIFAKAYPDRFFQAYIAEQNMVSVGVGLAARGFTAFVDTFSCFLSRAVDEVRMAAISRSNLSLCGSHCGISIGEDGPSQMGLEDIAIFRAVNGSVVLYPSDAVSAEQLTEYMARTDGIDSNSVTGWEWSETNGWVSAEQLRHSPPLGHLYAYLLANNFFVPMKNPARATAQPANAYAPG